MDTGSRVLFREEQRSRQRWLRLLIVVITAVVWVMVTMQLVFGRPVGSNPAPDWFMVVIWVMFGVCLPYLTYSIRLVTEVTTISIRLRYIPFWSRLIPFDQIQTVAARQYRPLAEYGGWGIRWSPSNGMAYNVSGHEGVQLELTGGRKLLIGSQRARELAALLNTQLQPASHPGIA